jgi:hypothetical protein
MKRLAFGVLLVTALASSAILLADGGRFTLALPGITERVSADSTSGVGDISQIPKDEPAEETLTQLRAPTEGGNAYTTPLILNPDVAEDYPDALGTLTYYEVSYAFRGHIDATGLLPGFPYQLKLIGKPSCADWWAEPDDGGNEQLGPEGFWWHFSDGMQTDPSRKVYNDYEEYDDCGHGDDPLPDPDAGYRLPEVPHDFVPAQTEDWCYEGTLVFYGMMSDANGNISWDFVADWSYPHAPPEDNRDDHPFVLPNGLYNVRFVLNESAHNPEGYGGPSTAQWRGVLLDDNVTFEIRHPVGGIAELPGGSGPSGRNHMALAALAAAALVTLAAGAWHAKRRWAK